ncbi:hypothetical protein NG798_13470 [Ancylothrix sp. C2]|uniref:hypothetical protein n=1 Tax=Ancylothrix sp. D3o TaxID=2953691 RepID=UPI0021BB90E9|nr:hypothetical protein [Ancylothrix sp. D3o]MCT7950803.1 hypothetical protein [Ancylothrix sp. D3o]
MQRLSLNLHSNSQTSEILHPVSRWAKFSALVALINLVLVLFNTSYIPLRNFYVRQFPQLVAVYDPLKGIKPHPVTQKYLRTVDELGAQVSQTGLENSQTQQLLQTLRRESEILMDENPFSGGLGSETFAQVQQRISAHVGNISAKQAFEQFWSVERLKQAGLQSELVFFNSQIRPLILPNYSRSLNQYGYPIDNFWMIDSFFIGFFGLEFLIGTYWLSRRLSVKTWLDAMIRRWYDVFLVLPFLRPLRVISVGVRLHQAGLLKFDRFLVQASHEPAAPLADQMTDLVIIRIINKLQNAIRNGDAARFLLEPKPLVTVNNVDEVEAITDRLMQVTISKVLPKVQPNLEALMHHSIESAFKQSNLYQGLQKIPALGVLPREVIEQTANYLAGAAVDVVASSYSDTQAKQILDQLTRDFSAELRRQLRDTKTLSEIENLLSDWLEELKLNYLVHSGVSDTEDSLAEAEVLRQVDENQTDSLPTIS